MSPSRPFILRPVATSLLMAAILLVGIVSYTQLPVSALPEVDYPTIQVLTFYPGASPTVTSTTVTAPLERQFGQLQGLSQMTSTSSGGVSVVVLQFNLSLNIDIAEEEVQSAINASQSFLPANLPAPPIYSKNEPCRCSSFDIGDHVEDDAAVGGGGSRRYAVGAEDLSAEWSGTGQHQRWTKTCGAHSGESYGVVIVWHQS